MAGRKGSKHIPLELKMEVVRLFYEERKTKEEIKQALGLRTTRSVKEWVRQYRREGEEAFTKHSGRPRKVEGDKTRLAQLEMENALLKKYHTELRKSLLAKRNIGSSITTGRNTK